MASLDDYAFPRLQFSHPCSGRLRDLKRGFKPLAHEAHPKIFGCHAHFQALECTHKYCLTWVLKLDKVTCLVLVTKNDDRNKSSEISNELICDCVTMPGCCCCMPLLHNHLMDSCSYVHKNILSAAKGGCICTLLTPLNMPLLWQCTWHWTMHQPYQLAQDFARCMSKLNPIDMALHMDICTYKI